MDDACLVHYDSMVVTTDMDHHRDTEGGHYCITGQDHGILEAQGWLEKVLVVCRVYRGLNGR